MSGFSVEVKIDNEKLIRRLERKVKADVEKKAILKGLTTGGLLIQGEAIKSIQSHRSKGETYEFFLKKNRKTGAIFPSEKRSKPHTASRPGYPPNSDTGKLVQSIQLAINSEEPSVSVGTNLLYGAWLEFGTSQMEPRPWLGPAYLAQKKAVIEEVKRALKESKE